MGTRGTDPERPTCPGCRARVVPARDVLCSNCWPQVPTDVRRMVREAQKDWRTDPTDVSWGVLMIVRERALESLPWDTKDR